jgi:hypothetical protein
MAEHADGPHSPIVEIVCNECGCDRCDFSTEIYGRLGDTCPQREGSWGASQKPLSRLQYFTLP